MKHFTPQSLRKAVAVMASLCAAVVMQAQAPVDRVEYFWDNDPGFDQATTLAITPGAELNIETLLPAPDQTGIHLLGLRYHGLQGWSPTQMQYVYVPVTDDTSVSHAEYFWDDDPGFGQAATLRLPTTGDGQHLDLGTLIAVSDTLAPGIHQLGVRYQGTNGWSPTLIHEVYISRAEAATVQRAEYFWDTDPGFGLGTVINLPGLGSAQSLDVDELIALADSLAPGIHTLGLRYRGTNGWSPTLIYEVYKTNDGLSLIASAEYFWNEDPGYGHGTPISIDPGKEISLDGLGIPTADVHGDALFFIRYRGAFGWSPTLCYAIMVDAEGHYTLNAQAATSAEERNYQSLDDAVNDFCDRGIGNSIELEITTTDAPYTFDATADAQLAQLTQMADNLERLSTPKELKTITFSAKADAPATVEMTAPSLQAVMPLLSHVVTDNVQLLVNGAEYCFNNLAARHQTVCPGTATAPVDLSTIGHDITATFTAQPHDGSVLGGYAAESTGTLPAMTMQNVGTVTDSVAYLVSIKQADTEIYAYTYYIYMRASMANQTFSGMTPAAGSSLDPGTVTLKWNPLTEVDGGYRLVVTEQSMTAVDGSPADTTTVDLSATTYQLTVKSGYRYTWQVTAVGSCDELPSPLMTLEGRLLPDLAVTSVTLPEGAEAGNTISVVATIVNQGEGATTEDNWTDRLYYVIDSDDFAKAVQAAEQQHTGNLQPDGSYDVTFQMQVPYVETGTLRAFVVTDVAAKVLESDADNNRTLSATSATLSPFYMNKDDLAALRQLYADFGGADWNGTRWDINSEIIKTGNWSGVTFNTEGRVTAINLQARALTGSFTTAVPSVATMSQLQSLNLSQNALTGDPALYLKDAGAALTTVDLSYNQIDELSSPLPATIKTLSLGYQHRQYRANTTYPGLDAIATRLLNVGSDMTVSLPAVYGYDHAAQGFTQHPNLDVWTPDMRNRYGRLVWSNTNDCYAYQESTWKQTAQQDEDVVLVSIDGTTTVGSVLPARMHLTTGDANMSGFVDVTDVQRTLNYVIDQNNWTIFCLWAANTFTENEPADLINIQDIVATVNIVLAEQSGNASRRRAPSQPAEDEDADADAEAFFYADGHYISLDADVEVAAFCLDLQGVRADQVRLLLNGADWQMQTRNTADGVRLLVFSPTGQTLFTGTQRLLRVSGSATPVAATASDALAEPVVAATPSPLPTAIDGSVVGDQVADSPLYDLQGRQLSNDAAGKRQLRSGIYIRRSADGRQGKNSKMIKK